MRQLYMDLTANPLDRHNRVSDTVTISNPSVHDRENRPATGPYHTRSAGLACSRWGTKTDALQQVKCSRLHGQPRRKMGVGMTSGEFNVYGIAWARSETTEY